MPTTTQNFSVEQGIVSGEDVAKASELGSKGILVASGIVKSKNWSKIMTEFAKSMV